MNPVLPQGWDWTAVSSMPYRGRAATILAVKRGAERTLYTTVGVRSDWKQVLVSDALQERYAFEPAEQAFWLVVPGQGNGHELLAASDTAIAGKLRRRGTNQVLLEVSIPAGGIVRKELPQ